MLINTKEFQKKSCWLQFNNTPQTTKISLSMCPCLIFKLSKSLYHREMRTFYAAETSFSSLLPESLVSGTVAVEKPWRCISSPAAQQRGVFETERHGVHHITLTAEGRGLLGPQRHAHTMCPERINLHYQQMVISVSQIINSKTMSLSVFLWSCGESKVRLVSAKEIFNIKQHKCPKSLMFLQGFSFSGKTDQRHKINTANRVEWKVSV